MTTKSNNKETKIKDIFNKIQTGVTNIIESGEYAKFFIHIVLIILFLYILKCQMQQRLLDLKLGKAWEEN